jgi:murein DD-endopeptidase MepM/ murein hydrolase activator NlpD
LARKNCQYHYYWNTKNSQLHYGIDIICTQNAKIYAMANGTIQNVGISSFELSAPNLQYFDNDSTYTATILYSNVRLNSGISSGSAVTAGQEIGYVTNEKNCGAYNSSYLHISILQENINIDPMLLIE